MTAKARIRRDLVMNVAFALLKATALVWAIRLASLSFSPANLGIFLLARRLASTGANLCQMGMSQTLLRQVPVSGNASAVKRLYVFVACVAWLGTSALVVPNLLLSQEALASWVFPGADGAEQLIWWVGVLALVTVPSFLAYSVLLGDGFVVLANLADLMAMSGLLVIAFSLMTAGMSPADILRFQTVGVAVLSLSVLGVYLATLRSDRESEKNWRAVLRMYAVYGLPRGVITGLDMVMLSIGPWLLRGQPEQAGYLVIALSVVQLCQVGLTPVTQIASIVAARFVGRGDTAALKEETRLLLGGALYVTVPTLAVLTPWAEHALRVWLSDPTVVAGVSFYLWWLVWGVVPLTIFQGLRGIVEMRWFEPRNLYTLLVGAAVQLGMYSLVEPDVGRVAAVRLSLLTGLWALGLMTLIWVGPASLGPLRYWGLGRLVGASAALAGLNAWAAGEPGLSGAAIAFVVSAVAIVGVLALLKPPPAVQAVWAFVWSPVESEPSLRV